MLTVLFVPPDRRLHDTGFPVEELVGLLVSQRAGAAHLGYLDSQLARWLGEKGQRRVKRPELVEKCGYDGKYVAHAIRLGVQGTELLRTGRITLPIPEPWGSKLRAIRGGEVPEAEALVWSSQVREELATAAVSSWLPLAPDRAAVLDFLERWHLGRI